MSDRCSTCGQHLPVEQATPEAKEWRKIPEGVKEKAFLLSKHERCQADWKEFLLKLQGKDQISLGQWKFYKLIHYKCFGQWPATAPEVQSHPVPIMLGAPSGVTLNSLEESLFDFGGPDVTDIPF